MNNKFNLFFLFILFSLTTMSLVNGEISQVGIGTSNINSTSGIPKVVITIPTVVTPVNYSLVNVNNSQFLRGLTPQEVANLVPVSYSPFTNDTLTIYQADTSQRVLIGGASDDSTSALQVNGAYNGTDGTRTTSLNNGLYSVQTNAGIYADDGVGGNGALMYNGFGVNGVRGASGLSSTSAGYFYDNAGSNDWVYLADGSYVINADGNFKINGGGEITGGTGFYVYGSGQGSPYDTSRLFEVGGKGAFTDGTRTAQFTDGTSAGYFADSSKTVDILGTGGSALSWDVPSWWGGALGGSGGSLYTGDSVGNQVYLSDGTYAINTVGNIKTDGAIFDSLDSASVSVNSRILYGTDGTTKVIAYDGTSETSDAYLSFDDANVRGSPTMQIHSNIEMDGGTLIFGGATDDGTSELQLYGEQTLTDSTGGFGKLYTINDFGSNAFILSAGTDNDFAIQPNILLSNGVSFSSIDDANSQNQGVEFRASEIQFTGGAGSDVNLYVGGISSGTDFVGVKTKTWDGVSSLQVNGQSSFTDNGVGIKSASIINEPSASTGSIIATEFLNGLNNYNFTSKLGYGYFDINSAYNFEAGRFTGWSDGTDTDTLIIGNYIPYGSGEHYVMKGNGTSSFSSHDETQTITLTSGIGGTGGAITGIMTYDNKVGHLGYWDGSYGYGVYGNRSKFVDGADSVTLVDGTNAINASGRLSFTGPIYRDQYNLVMEWSKFADSSSIYPVIEFSSTPALVSSSFTNTYGTTVLQGQPVFLAENGTTGTYKKIAFYAEGGADTYAVSYTFPTPFDHIPYVYGNASIVSATSVNITGITFTGTGSSISGHIFVEGI